MTTSKTDESLKSFLFTFQICLDQFNEILRDLYEQVTHGSQTIEQIATDLHRSMWKDIEQEQTNVRDRIVSIKQEQDVAQHVTAFDELVQLLHIDTK
jgi:hypothetical protein